MKSTVLNPIKTKLLNFKTSNRLSMDEQTRPSMTPRSDDPYLQATNPALNASLIKILREKDEQIRMETTNLWQTQLAYRKELEACENELQNEISLYHQRLLQEVRRNTQLQLQLEMLQQNQSELPPQSHQEERSSTLTLLNFLD